MQQLANLKGQLATVSESDPTLDDGAVLFAFDDGTLLRSDYWRLVKNKRSFVSSFDHNQKYGLPNPINAAAWLKNEIRGQSVVAASLDIETGDIHLSFTADLSLQILNVTGYEVWELRFPDSSVAYSNYNR